MKQRFIQHQKIPAKFLKAFSEFADILLWINQDIDHLRIWINNQTPFINIKQLKKENELELLLQNYIINPNQEQFKTIFLGEKIPEFPVEIPPLSSHHYLYIKPHLINWRHKKYLLLSCNLVHLRNSRENALLRQIEIYTQTQKLAKVGSWEINWVKNDFWLSLELRTILKIDDSIRIESISDFLYIVHPDDREIVKKSFLHTQQSKETKNITFRIAKPNEPCIYVAQNTIGIFDKNNTLSQTIGALIDITETKNFELALQQKNNEIAQQRNEYKLLNQELELAISLAASSNDYFQKIFDEAPIGIFLFSANGDITNCNNAFCEINQKSKKELLRYNLLKPYFNEKIHELINNTFEYGNAIFEGNCNTLSNNNKLILRIKSSLVKDSSKNATRGLALVENITPIIQFQNELKVAQMKADESNRLKSAFLANMSHEIRTPLNAILGFTQILKEKKVEPEKEKKFLNIILSSGQHLLNLINDVLDLSKIESGQMELENTDVELNDLFIETSTIFQSYKLNQNKNNIEIKLTIPKSQVIFYTDRTKFLQILNNLLSNAIRYTTAGSVHFGFEIHDNKLIVFVEDTGIGIHQEERQLIFERFRQSAYSTNKTSGGTGLGLALVKAFCTLMNAEISLHSVPGKGTTFRIIFPYIGSI